MLVSGAMSCTGVDEASGNDDARSRDDRRGDVGGGRFPRGAYLGQEDGNPLQPHDPAALQAGSSKNNRADKKSPLHSTGYIDRDAGQGVSEHLHLLCRGSNHDHYLTSNLDDELLAGPLRLRVAKS